MGTQRTSYSNIISVLTIIITYLFCLGFSQETPVLDVDGNPLLINVKYYMLAQHNGGGGLALSIRDKSCPDNVMQENDPASVGLSVRIFPVGGKPNISRHTDMNIVFNAATICVQPTLWRLGTTDPSTRRRYVRSGGVLGRPGAETVANWFKIDGSSGSYKIVYCPSVCSGCGVDCGEVGVFVENGRRWLGVGGEPLVIVFKKVV